MQALTTTALSVGTYKKLKMLSIIEKQKKLKTPKSELKQTGRGNNYAYLALGESG